MKPIQDTRLYQEIHEQPDVIRKLVSQPQHAIVDLANQIRSHNIHHVFIAARGTSDNAGRYAKYLLGAHNQMVVSLAQTCGNERAIAARNPLPWMQACSHRAPTRQASWNWVQGRP